MLFDVMCFALSGFFMKISDEAMDEKNNKMRAVFAGLLCVFFTVLISVTNGDAACIFLSILIGTAFARKIDAINHVISAILFVLILIYAGVPHFSWICLIVCIVAAYIDEIGNNISDENEKKNEKETLFDKFFKYRYSLKVAVLVLSMAGLLNMVLPNSPFTGWYFFEPVTFISFYFFDLSYEFAGLYFNRFYNLF